MERPKQNIHGEVGLLISQEEPDVWHHDIFRANGTPYSKEETNFIKKMLEKQ